MKSLIWSSRPACCPSCSSAAASSTNVVNGSASLAVKFLYYAQASKGQRSCDPVSNPTTPTQTWQTYNERAHARVIEHACACSLSAAEVWPLSQSCSFILPLYSSLRFPLLSLFFSLFLFLSLHQTNDSAGVQEMDGVSIFRSREGGQTKSKLWIERRREGGEWGDDKSTVCCRLWSEAAGSLEEQQHHWHRGRCRKLKPLSAAENLLLEAVKKKEGTTESIWGESGCKLFVKHASSLKRWRRRGAQIVCGAQSRCCKKKKKPSHPL